MTDLRSLSDDQLRAAFEASQAPAAPVDLSGMSDADLIAAHKQASSNTVGRKLALGTRDVVQGLSAVPGMAYDAARLPINAAIWGANKLGAELPYARSARENVSGALDQAGLPHPETRNERILSAVNEGGASMLVPAGVGAKMTEAASPLVAGIGKTLAAQPASQVASGMGGGAGSQTAKEMGYGPGVQAAAGLTGALAAPLAMSGVAKALGPNVRPEVQELIDKGVTPTYGQIQGRGAKASEDIAARLPGIGPKIQEAQERATQQFSTAAVNDALAPIGQRIQAGQTGNKAVAEAHRILADEYKNVLGPIKAVPDGDFLAGVRSAAAKAPAEELAAIQDAVKEQFGSITGAISGEKLQQARRAFERMAYDTENTATASAYKGIADSITGLMTRAAPNSAAELSTVDKAWSMFKRVQDAATRESTSGTFSPQNLAASSLKLDRFNGAVPYSEGRAVMQPMAQTGLEVLGKSPIARGEPALSLPQALAHPFALAGGWARYPMYTAAGQRMTAQALTQRPEYARAIADALRANPAMNVMAAGANAR